MLPLSSDASGDPLEKLSKPAIGGFACHCRHPRRQMASPAAMIGR